MHRLLQSALVAGLALAAPAVASDEVLLTALDDSHYDATREGVVQLLCENMTTGRIYLSRAIALELPGVGEDFDILLAARHGVIDQDGERGCWVRGSDREQAGITRIVTSAPKSTEPNDFNHDWAILRTAGRLPASTPRVRAAVYSGHDSGELSLLVRAVEYAPCAITTAPSSIDDPNLIFHDCPSRPGLSGSPMLSLIDGEPYVVGVHLGRYLMLGQQGADYSVARRLSGEFLVALHAFIAEETAP
jgi:hypothetical protein